MTQCCVLSKVIFIVLCITTFAYNIIEFKGYVALPSCRTSCTYYTHTLQDMSNNDAKPADPVRLRLPSISRGVPILNQDNLVRWQFLLEARTRACDESLADYIFQDNGLASDDLTEVKVEETEERKKFKKEFESSPYFKKLMYHFFSALLETVSEADQSRLYSVPQGQGLMAYRRVLSMYTINTERTRTDKLREFMCLELERGQHVAAFISQLEQTASNYNRMAGVDTDITERMKKATLLSAVRKTHADEFRNVLDLIDQTPNNTYASVCKQLTVAANARVRDEQATAKAARELEHAKQVRQVRQIEPARQFRQGGVGGDTVTSSDNRPECWEYRDYGGCTHHTCTFKHGTPGTKRCPHCGGKHRPKNCPSKPVAPPAQNAKKAKTAGDPGDVAPPARTGPAPGANAAPKQDKATANAARSTILSHFVSSEDEDYYSDEVPLETANVARADATPTKVSTKSNSITSSTSSHDSVGNNSVNGVSTPTQPPKPPKKNFLQKVCGNPFKLLTTATIAVMFALIAAVHVSPTVERVAHTNPQGVIGIFALLLLCGTLGGGPVAAADVDFPVAFAGNGVHSCVGQVCMRASGNTTGPYGYLEAMMSIDSAASSHLTHNRSLLDPKTIRSRVTKIETANGHFMYSVEVGDATLKMKDSRGTIRKLHLKDVLYVPNASSNLISVGRLLDAHHRVVFDDGRCTIIKKSVSNSADGREGDHTVIEMRKHMFDLEHVHSDHQQAKIADSCGALSEHEVWHNRLCHYSGPYIRKAVGLDGSSSVAECEACIKSDMQRRAFSKTTTVSRAEAVTRDRLDLVMADTCQPFSSSPSVGGNKYFFLFIDIHTRKKWIRFGSHKSDLKWEFKDWCAQVQNETGRLPVKFMPDGGGEFNNKDLEGYLKQQGIMFEMTCTDCPNQNAVVERANGVVQRHIHKLLAHAGLPNKYWEDAARFAVEVQNAMPSKTLGWASPNSKWSSKHDTTLERVRTFGCEVWYHIPQAHRRKGDDKASKGVYLGTSYKHKGWRILDLETRKIVNSRDAYFNESVFPFKGSKESRSPAVVAAENDDCVIFSGSLDAVAPRPPGVPAAGGVPVLPVAAAPPGVPAVGGVPVLPVADAAAPAAPAVDASVPANLVPQIRPRRSARTKNPVNYKELNIKTKLRNLNGDAVNVGYTGLGAVPAAPPAPAAPAGDAVPDQPIDIQVPAHGASFCAELNEIASTAIGLQEDFKKMTRRQIMQTPYAKQFLEAEKRELAALKKHRTYRIVKRPPNRIPISCRWCYDVKRDADNNIILFKARLVARGYEQKEGIDYKETFAATAQMKSFRLILALSKLLGLKVTQIDISSAFLHGVLEEELYMSFPPAYKPAGHDDSCLKLEKGIYGLKQAGRIWNKKFVSELSKIGFTQLSSDTQVLIYRNDNNICIMSLHVDDAIIACNDETFRKQVITELEQHFLVKDLGDAAHYLGIRVTQSESCNEITQDAYVDKMLAKFNMVNANSVDTPGAPGQILTRLDCPADKSPQQQEMAAVPYRQLVGSLMYLYICTRPDTGAPLVKVASFNNNPGMAHWKAAKRILRYAKGTGSQGIKYTGHLDKGQKVKITAYCDSDWAQDPDDRKSTSGYVVMVAGGPVMWQCRKQPTVALSTTEAEFVALTEVTKDILWLTYFLGELGIEYDTPEIYSDSQSAGNWSTNACHHQRNKHVALKYFFIRDEVAKRTIKVAYICSQDNVADILTKFTSKSIFARLQPRLMGYAHAARAVMDSLEKGVRQMYNCYGVPRKGGALEL